MNRTLSLSSLENVDLFSEEPINNNNNSNNNNNNDNDNVQMNSDGVPVLVDSGCDKDKEPNNQEQQTQLIVMDNIIATTSSCATSVVSSSNPSIISDPACPQSEQTESQRTSSQTPEMVKSEIIANVIILINYIYYHRHLGQIRKFPNQWPVKCATIMNFNYKMFSTKK